jgi:LysR family tcuABC transcriptional regulator
MEIDGLAVLMDAVRCGLGATIQPGAAVVRLFDDEVLRIEIQDPHTVRRNLLASLPEEELSPAALAARIVLRDVATEEASLGHWPGATLYQH